LHYPPDVLKVCKYCKGNVTLERQGPGRPYRPTSPDSCERLWRKAAELRERKVRQERLPQRRSRNRACRSAKDPFPKARNHPDAPLWQSVQVRRGTACEEQGLCASQPRPGVATPLPRSNSGCSRILLACCASTIMERRAGEPETPDCCSSRHLPWTVSEARRTADGRSGHVKWRAHWSGLAAPP
jgi:hypothetical protein